MLFLFFKISIRVTSLYKFFGGPSDLAGYFGLRGASQHIPSSYAVCTPSGAGIYTVDDENRKVECIFVDGDRIAVTGARSKLPLCYDGISI